MGLLSGLFGSKIDVQELIGRDALIVDVRSPGEFSGGHIKGSRNIPLGQIRDRVERFQKMGKPVILCCASGNRSGQATRILKAEGIEAYNGGGWRSLAARLR